MLGPAKPRRLDEPIAVSLEDLVPADHFYRHLEAKLDLGFVRDWARELLRRAGPAQHRPGRLLQAAAGHVLRGHPLRAPAHRDGQPQPGPPLVPRLRPRRGPARPLQPDPHPAAARGRHLPALLRAGRRSVPGGRAGLGPGAVLRRHQGRRPTPTSTPSSPASTTRPRPTSPTCSPTMPHQTARGRAERQPADDLARGRRAGCRASALPTRRGRRSRAALAAAGGAAAGPAPARGRQLPAHDRLPGEHDRPRRHADAHRARDGPGLPRPLRRRRRQARASSSPPWSPRPT